MKRAFMAVLLVMAVVLCSESAKATQIQVYGAWHCGNDYCTWGTVRDMTDFDTKNHWMIDRGDGLPSVNLVILSFVDPLKLLNQTNDAQTANGIPIGMNSAVVSYFTSHNIRVMLSIGGVTYTTYWDQALAQNASLLGTYAAQAAQRLGVGMEIDYENNTNPNMTGLQAFINAYRAVVPYDATGANPAARLTIDLAAGDQYLVQIAATATANWLTTSTPVLDYANAMVPNKQPPSASSAEDNWQEHISGYPRITPPVPPLAPAKMTGGLYIVTGQNPCAECTTFSGSLEDTTGSYVQTVAPAGAGTTSGMLGYMFWAAECPGTHEVCTTPPNTCQGGVGVGAKTYNVAFPMPAEKQDRDCQDSAERAGWNGPLVPGLMTGRRYGDARCGEAVDSHPVAHWQRALEVSLCACALRSTLMGHSSECSGSVEMPRRRGNRIAEGRAHHAGAVPSF